MAGNWTGAVGSTTGMRGALSDQAIGVLAETFRGNLIRPGDAEYDAARRIWNGMIDRRPALIARCAGPADVMDGVRFARQHGLPLAVRSGGHNVAGTALCDDGIVLDLSGMRGVRVDPIRRTVRVQAGVTNGDLDRETQAFGLAVTSGIASTTGLAGLTLGGGVGWLMRRFGLTCDNLLSADLVTAEGQLITVSPDTYDDLFWAIRGGGGNFGVVTEFEYRLHPLGPNVVAGLVLHPAKHARDALRFYRDFVREAPDALGAIVNLRHAPPAPWIPAELHGAPVIAMTVCYAGPVDEALVELAPLKRFGSPLVDTIERTRYLSHQRLFDPTVPSGWRYYWKSHYLHELSDQVIDVLVTHAWRDTSPLSYTLIPLMGGAVSRVAPDATAFVGRDGAHLININAVWTDPTEDDEHIAWAREFFAATEPFSTGGVYVNFLGNEGEARVRAAYGANYARLAEIKRRYDPENVFRFNQNIAPAGTT
ncbi:FAD-binding oxidoreductase [Thermomicrobiaceae bacterium CFH 74404]|uniref:FAD-binding oxidoreductase n=2 Tax=Thermalbibacter longus TaxID=2951981 RepID=A0AA42BBF4_9BACT|nr:FAD-binding oxidoreductase [Thermalbibacter longus]MCM8749774.1 FAD-binding oxidoreductase [Thermalbibacter longus]